MHTLGKSEPHALVQNPSCCKTNYTLTRTDLIFWVCLALRNQSATACVEDLRTTHVHHVYFHALLQINNVRYAIHLKAPITQQARSVFIRIYTYIGATCHSDKNDMR